MSIQPRNCSTQRSEGHEVDLTGKDKPQFKRRDATLELRSEVHEQDASWELLTKSGVDINSWETGT